MSIAKNISLYLGEMGLKAASIPAAGLAMASKGDALEKVIGGYSKFPTLAELPEDVKNAYLQTSKILHDLNTMPAIKFIGEYGRDATENALLSANTALEYINQLQQNISEQPSETLIAAITAFTLAYGGSRILKFIRQKGQGSAIQKLERKLGEQIFKKK